jgi:hypothetical protein
MFKSSVVLVPVIFLGYATSLFSQELSHQVLVTAAGIKIAGNLEYTQTIGETAVEIFSSETRVLTQGFQQPRIIFSKETPPSGNGVNVFPNPVSDNVNIELFGNTSRSFRIEILNISGTLVRTERIAYSGQFWEILHYPVDQLSKGLYIVRITSDDGVINRTFKIDKM